MRKGLLIIISGPSGVGKGTVREFIMNDPTLNLAFSVSCTTRAPRNGEINGREYFFISKQKFEEYIKEERFLEHANFCGNYYGTLIDFVDELRNKGKNVIVEIETNGAKQIIEKLNGNDEISIFIIPPSLDELERRIRGRKTETEEVIKERMKKAEEELKLAPLYDYVVQNINPVQCGEEIKQIIKNKLK